MLDRQVVKEFLQWKFEDTDIERPDDISEEVLVETFCRYVENDYYEWLKDNYKSFFNYGNPNWAWVRKRIDQYSKE